MIDTRRYQLMIGGFGLLLLVAFSVYLFAHGRTAMIGVPAGDRLHEFVAPLATSNLDVPANVDPRCDPARPARRGLNVCPGGALVLAFFTPGAKTCERAVDALQALAPSFPSLRFGAVAIDGGKATTAKLVHSRRWTIPVAFDMTGAVGQLYDVEVCPLIELVRPGGVVAARLIGNHWQTPAVLAPRLRVLAGRASPAA